MMRGNMSFRSLLSGEIPKTEHFYFLPSEISKMTEKRDPQYDADGVQLGKTNDGVFLMLRGPCRHHSYIHYSFF